MKLGLEVDPEEFATFILLCREDVYDEVVPVEEPSLPENIQDIENRGDIGLLNPRGGRAVGAGDRRGRGSDLHLLVRKRENRGGKLASRSRRGSHHQREMVVVRVPSDMSKSDQVMPMWASICLMCLLPPG
jgi:hypothetical protein